MSHTYMSEQEIREAEQRCQQATPGEWELRSNLPYSPNGVVIFSGYGKNNTTIGRWQEKRCLGVAENVDFIAHARTDLPRALSDVRELRRVVRGQNAILSDASVILAALHLSEKWELADDIKAAIADAIPKLTAALALAQQVEGGK